MTLESSPAGAWAASAEGPNEDKGHTISDQGLLGTYNTRASSEFNVFISPTLSRPLIHSHDYENHSHSISFIEQYKSRKASSFSIQLAKSLLITLDCLIWTPVAILMHYNQSIGAGFKYRHLHRLLVKLYARFTLRKQHCTAEIRP